MTAPAIVTPDTARCRNFAFARDGAVATCVCGRADAWSLTAWHWTGAGVRRMECAPVPLDPGTQGLPLDDGAILLFPNATESHDVLAVEPGRGPGGVEVLGEVHALGGYLLPAPVADSGAYLVTRDDIGHSTIWRITRQPGGIRPLVTIPGSVTGGVWLDPAGRLLAVNRSLRAGEAGALVVDLVAAQWKPLLPAATVGTVRVLLGDPRSTLLVVGTRAAGGRIGWVRLAADRRVRFPARFDSSRPDPADPGPDLADLRPLALDDTGERVLLHRQQGARSTLWIVDPPRVELTPVRIPRGTSYGGYLGLLAAAAEPRLWSGCAALAPLLSGPRLRADSPSWIAARLDGLGALDAATEDGAPDLLRWGTRISVPLLLIHGTADEVIPVGQSRRLVRELRRHGVPVRYRETADDHEQTTGAESPEVRAELVRFCRAEGSRR